MQKLFKYLKAYRKEIILGPAFKLVEAIFELIVPILMANVIDIGIPGKDTDYILRMGGLMVLFSAVGLCSTLVCQYFAARASQGFGTVLRRELFAHIGRMSHAEIDRIGTSTLTTRITNDVNQLQVGLAMFIRLAIRAPFLVIGATVMAAGIDLQLSLIFLVVAAGIAITLYLVMRKASPFYTTIQKLLDRLSRLVRENLGGARPVRAFSRQNDQKQQFDKASGEVLRAQQRVGRISALLNPLTYLIVNMGIIAVLWFGGSSVDSGLLKQGEVVALINYLTQILLALMVVANLVIIFTRAGASGGRVAEILETQPSVASGHGHIQPIPAAPLVEFRDVAFSYGASTETALSGVNLAIERGQTVGIIGGTGAGKSTLVDLIPRFYDATRGQVLFEGADVRDYTLDALRAKVGIVPQYAHLFKGTVRENMRWGDADATDEQIWQALDAAQAASFISAKPEGLDFLIEQNGRNLSGGQRQRLTIARALVRQPELLILDDSSSALDFATDAALRKAIHQLENVTVLMVSQRASTLRGADKIVVVDDGRITGVGTHDELLQTNEDYREIVLSQIDEGGEGA